VSSKLDALALFFARLLSGSHQEVAILGLLNVCITDTISIQYRRLTIYTIRNCAGDHHRSRPDSASREGSDVRQPNHRVGHGSWLPCRPEGGRPLHLHHSRGTPHVDARGRGGAAPHGRGKPLVLGGVVTCIRRGVAIRRRCPPGAPKEKAGAPGETEGGAGLRCHRWPTDRESDIAVPTDRPVSRTAGAGCMKARTAHAASGSGAW